MWFTTSKMAQLVQVLAAKPEGPSWIPGTRVKVEGQNQFSHTVSSDLHTCAVMYTVHTYG